MSQDGERLAVLETQVKNQQRELDEMKSVIKSINKQIWMASGAVSALMVILKFILH